MGHFEEPGDIATILLLFFLSNISRPWVSPRFSFIPACHEAAGEVHHVDRHAAHGPRRTFDTAEPVLGSWRYTKKLYYIYILCGILYIQCSILYIYICIYMYILCDLYIYIYYSFYILCVGT